MALQLTGLDLTRPTVPVELATQDLANYPADELEVALDESWLGIVKELQDAQLSGRTHNQRSTYESGCRGPMCRKAHREDPRRRTQDPTRAMPPRMERSLDPVLEYFFIVAKIRIRAYELELLAAIRNG